MEDQGIFGRALQMHQERNLPDEPLRPEVRRKSSQEQINAVTKAIRLADVQFNGDVKKTNPVWFIEQIENIGEGELVGEEALKRVFRTAMKGVAANWVRFADTGNYEQLKVRFLDKFWSEPVQREIFAYLKTGAYEGRGTRENYFLKWATQARYLEHFPNDEDIINTLKWHFTEGVIEKVELRQPQTIWEMAKLLARIDGIGVIDNKLIKARGKERALDKLKQFNNSRRWDKNSDEEENENNNHKKEKKIRKMINLKNGIQKEIIIQKITTNKYVKLK